MKTALQIDDALLSDAKELALDRGRTLTEFVEDALRFFISQQRSTQTSKQPFRLHVVEEKGLQPGVDLNENAQLADSMDGLSTNSKPAISGLVVGQD